MANFRNLNEALAALEGRAITTSQGSFIKLSDLQELMAQFKESRIENTVPSGPRSFNAAKQAAKRDEALQQAFAPQPAAEVAAREAFRGQSIPSATEGVKS